jgi:Rps23 Pro-64 3,4-dihydroxylase Tpa1-like proline 4-hydroxylase
MFSFPKAEWERKPFPHTVIRGAWSADRLRQCKYSLSDPLKPVKWSGEKTDAGNSHNKRWCNRWEDMPAAAVKIIRVASRPEFLLWLEELTGIKGLVPDPYLKGGGVHRIGRGGFLKMHTDFNFHNELRLYRRLNLLLYLNEHWCTEWGGDLVLGRTDGICYPVKPEANTMVVFETSNKSWHGHGHPLETPEGVYRDSIALYYYTAEPAVGDEEKRMSTNYGS